MENNNLILGINPENEKFNHFKINQNDFNFKNINNAWGIKLIEYDEKEMVTRIPNEIRVAFRDLEDARMFAKDMDVDFIIVPCKMDN